MAFDVHLEPEERSEVSLDFARDGKRCNRLVLTNRAAYWAGQTFQPEHLWVTYRAPFSTIKQFKVEKIPARWHRMAALLLVGIGAMMLAVDPIFRKNAGLLAPLVVFGSAYFLGKRNLVRRSLMIDAEAIPMAFVWVAPIAWSADAISRQEAFFRHLENWYEQHRSEIGSATQIASSQSSAHRQAATVSLKHLGMAATVIVLAVAAYVGLSLLDKSQTKAGLQELLVQRCSERKCGNATALLDDACQACRSLRVERVALHGMSIADDVRAGVAVVFFEGRTVMLEIQTIGNSLSDGHYVKVEPFELLKVGLQ